MTITLNTEQLIILAIVTICFITCVYLAGRTRGLREARKMLDEMIEQAIKDTIADKLRETERAIFRDEVDFLEEEEPH